jgi:hypothetical protein
MTLGALRMSNSRRLAATRNLQQLTLRRRATREGREAMYQASLDLHAVINRYDADGADNLFLPCRGFRKAHRSPTRLSCGTVMLRCDIDLSQISSRTLCATRSMRAFAAAPLATTGLLRGLTALPVSPVFYQSSLSPKMSSGGKRTDAKLVAPVPSVRGLVV